MAVLAGAFLGMAGAVAIAAPASAHSPSVTGTATCVDAATGDWTIDWKVGNDHELRAFVRDIQLDPQLELTGKLSEPYHIVPRHSADRFPALQVPGSTEVTDPATTSVTMKVWLVWTDRYTNIDPAQATVSRPQECTPPTTTPPTTPPTTTPTTTPTTPPTTTPPTTTPTTPPVSGEATPILEMDCTTLTLGLDNPVDGKAITLHYKTSKGEERDTTINPGEKKTDTFSATPGFTVTVSAPELDNTTETITYKQPAHCSTGGGGLPVTGAAAGGIAGGAAVLLAIGGLLFYLARRRKVKFTA
jgi:hypothetical protein